MTVRSDVLKRTLSPTMSLVIIVGLSVIWGYHWAVMKIGLYYCGGLTYTAIRCIIAAPLMLLIVKLRGGGIWLKAPKAAVIVGIVQTAGNFGLGAIAVKFGEAGKSAVLTYTMPFWVLLLASSFSANAPARAAGSPHRWPASARCWWPRPAASPSSCRWRWRSWRNLLGERCAALSALSQEARRRADGLRRLAAPGRRHQHGDLHPLRPW